ncbi:MAG: homoserine dehydrogenase, partial [Oscillochloris sp.]|nr:homoserine dehydrogenase [Oscillochloris sp.]
MNSISIIQIGVGGVGKELVEQVLGAQAALAARYGLRLEYLALADSSGVLTSDSTLTAAQVRAALSHKARGKSLATMPEGRVAQHWTDLLPQTPCIVVDMTAAAGNEDALAHAVAAGHRAVLANKKPLSAAWTYFTALTHHGATRYETTAGAGLPVISTLQGLLDSGDALTKIEAAMSGTLGYLCGELEAGVPLSTAVRAAHRMGYTEPDPRD